MNPEAKRNRYPGLAPFSTAQQDVFFGREKDIEQLYHKLMHTDQVLLYAKSGLGKSSLINAGVVPKILADNTDFIIVNVRFGGYRKGHSPKPIESVLAALPSHPEGSFLDKIIPKENSLWYHCKSLQLHAQGEPPTLLFVLDQFEELFSHPEEDIFRYKKQMADLLHSTVPKTFRKVLEKKQAQTPDVISPAERQDLFQPQKIKVLMAIREDRYSQMNQLVDFLPDAMHNRYALKALSPRQSREAITLPAQMKGEFVSNPFRYKEEALERILLYLSQGFSQPIETTQLQILCSHFEGLGISQVSLENIPDFKDIFLEFYKNSIDLLPKAAQKPARQFIEQELIKKSQRISLDRLICQDYLSEESLNTLIDRHLLRAERNTVGGISLELAHDTLIAPILQAKKEREAEEQKIKAEQDRLEEERRLKEQAEQDRLEKQKTQKQLRNTRLLLAFAFGALLLAAAGGIFAYTQSQYAKQRLNDFLKAQAAKQTLEFDALENRATTILAVEGFPQEIFHQMDSIAQIHPDSLLFKQRIKSLKNQLNPKYK